jgi:hypothetical protein
MFFRIPTFTLAIDEHQKDQVLDTGLESTRLLVAAPGGYEMFWDRSMTSERHLSGCLDKAKETIKYGLSALQPRVSFTISELKPLLSK